MRKYLAISALAAIAALSQKPAFEAASIRSAAHIPPEMIASGKLHFERRSTPEEWTLKIW